jgi:DNA (cytosine-5)-methyltransferase 3A
MNVLSLFDGISCAYEALNRSQIKINTYYASEIDKNALSISTKNHSDIIRLGDVKDIKTDSLLKVDLLIGGSPCQDLSIAKKDRKGLKGERSSLFWEYIRLKNEVNPTYFILENVASMSKEDKQIITETLGVEPIMFNASLVSAQSRKRLFWTNIKFELPEDKGIILKDILEPMYEIDERMTSKGKAFCLDASYWKGSSISHSIERHSRTLHKDGSKLTPIECERLMGLPDNYTEGIAMTNRYKCLGNAFNVDVVAHILYSIINT